MGTDEYNRKAYDQKLIRFPAGTVKKFHQIFGDISFNGWVVSLVISRLCFGELQFTDDEEC